MLVVSLTLYVLSYLLMCYDQLLVVFVDVVSLLAQLMLMLCVDALSVLAQLSALAQLVLECVSHGLFFLLSATVPAAR